MLKDIFNAERMKNCEQLNNCILYTNLYLINAFYIHLYLTASFYRFHFVLKSILYHDLMHLLSENIKRIAQIPFYGNMIS